MIWAYALWTIYAVGVVVGVEMIRRERLTSAKQLREHRERKELEWSQEIGPWEDYDRRLDLHNWNRGKR